MARAKSIEKTVREAVEEGLVYRGAKQALKAIRNGTASMIVISSTCPPKKREEIKKEAEKAGVECHDYDGTSLDLGELSKRPYGVSVLTIVAKKKTEKKKEAKKTAGKEKK